MVPVVWSLLTERVSFFDYLTNLLLLFVTLLRFVYSIVALSWCFNFPDLFWCFIAMCDIFCFAHMSQENITVGSHTFTNLVALTDWNISTTFILGTHFKITFHSHQP